MPPHILFVPRAPLARLTFPPAQSSRPSTGCPTPPLRRVSPLLETPQSLFPRSSRSSSPRSGRESRPTRPAATARSPHSLLASWNTQHILAALFTHQSGLQILTPPV